MIVKRLFLFISGQVASPQRAKCDRGGPKSEVGQSKCHISVLSMDRWRPRNMEGPEVDIEGPRGHPRNSIVCADFALDFDLDLAAPFGHGTAMGCCMGRRVLCMAGTGDAFSLHFLARLLCAKRCPAVQDNCSLIF